MTSWYQCLGWQWMLSWGLYSAESINDTFAPRHFLQGGTNKHFLCSYTETCAITAGCFFHSYKVPPASRARSFLLISYTDQTFSAQLYAEHRPTNFRIISSFQHKSFHNTQQSMTTDQERTEHLERKLGAQSGKSTTPTHCCMGSSAIKHNPQAEGYQGQPVDRWLYKSSLLKKTSQKSPSKNQPYFHSLSLMGWDSMVYHD